MTILIDERGRTLQPGTTDHWHANARRGVEVIVAVHRRRRIVPPAARSPRNDGNVTGPFEMAA